jgi:hypothetical protein
MSIIYIPKTLKVGFNRRDDTYSAKLAYVIYYDAKGKIRKEGSWESWRDKKIPVEELPNEPTSGFVLNRRVGGGSSSYGWNTRETKFRIYDPRDFEFEITSENLLYILENTSAIKGKGLEGDFVYGWQGKDLILIPTTAPEYAEHAKYSEMLQTGTNLKGKDLIAGAIYRTDQNEDLIYLGRFDEYETSTYSYNKRKKGESKGKRYYFYNQKTADTYKQKYQDSAFVRLTSLTHKIVKVVSAEPVENYADIMDLLEQKDFYNPYDPTRDIEYTPTVKQFRHAMNSGKEKEVLLNVDGLELVSTMYKRTVDEGEKYEFYYPSRRYEAKPEEITTETEYPYGRSYSSYNRTTQVDRKFDAAIAKIEANGDKYYNYSKQFTPVEELIKKYDIRLRRKFLRNGKEKR